MHADDVLPTLRRHMLVDGFDLVLDVAASRGSWLIDARDQRRWLDLFSFFASNPLGMNHPKLVDDPVFMADLAEAAVNKPSNSDVYTRHAAQLVEVFERVLGDPALPHLFFVEGGALAVENALKTAFDWKQRHNAAHGRDPELGTKVLHLTRAFHGRTGYTMSVTNTEPVKVAGFPQFDWPRIDVPWVAHPVADHLADTEARERTALAQAEAAFAAHGHDIACFLAEPIQGEGGDNHLRPEFFAAMAELCRANDALFVLDEVQTGCAMTGTPWAYQQLGVQPDVVAFGKKLQVCGIMAGGRLDEVEGHVFATSSRINSTWGGNLTDMVRARRILEVIEDDGLIRSAADQGGVLGSMLEGLTERHDTVTNPRGRGLMRAVTLDSAPRRDEVVARMHRDHSVLILGCGERSIRFRPTLTVTEEELKSGVDALDAVLATA